MKKQLLLLSLSLLLASCGGTSATSQPESQPAGDTSETTSQQTPGSEGASSASSSAQPTRAEILKGLFEEMATKGTCTYTDPGNQTKYYLGGDKGYLQILDPSQLTPGNPIGQGVLRLPNYGIVSYLYQNDTAGVDRTSLSVVSPNKQLSFADFENSVVELGLAGKEITFTESTKTHTFSTTDEDFVNSLLEMDGLGAAIGLFPTVKATVQLTDDNKGMTVGYVLDGSSEYKKISYSGMTITNIGTTKNTNVESFLASNPTMTAPTAWDADTEEFLGGANVLPFPGRATYAASMPLSEDEDSGLTTVFVDYGCGNILNAYGTQLTGAGYTLEPEMSDLANNIAVYSKVVVPASGVTGDLKLYVFAVFQSYTGENATYRPNGDFTIYAAFQQEIPELTPAQLNAHLSTFKLRWAPTVNAFPTFDFGTACTKIEFADQTESTEEYYSYMLDLMVQYGYYTSASFQCDFAGIAAAYYPTEAEATAAYNSIAATLTTAGYVEDDPVKYPGAYVLTDPAQVSEWSYEIDLEIGRDEDTGAYEGYLILNFMAAEIIIVE